MAGAIRNACVARGTIASRGSGSVFNVPAGYVLLLKSVVTQMSGSTPWQVDLVLIASDNGTAIQFASLKGDTGGSQAWSGWIALNGLDTLYLASSSSPFTYWVSGALLPYAPAPPLVSALPADAPQSTPQAAVVLVG